MKCECCRHWVDRCELTACAYRHIMDKDMRAKGVSLGGGLWEYEEKRYKVIDYEVATHCFICVEAAV